MHFVLKNNKKAKAKFFVVISSSPSLEKVKKTYCESDLYKSNIICVTLTNKWENYKRKYVTEVQREIRTKFNYYSEWIWDEKLLKSSRVWKIINTGKLRVYSSFPSVYHMLNSGEWMESYKQWMEIYEQKNTWKTEWSSGTRAEKFRFFTRCIFEESVSR